MWKFLVCLFYCNMFFLCNREPLFAQDSLSLLKSRYAKELAKQKEAALQQVSSSLKYRLGKLEGVRNQLTSFSGSELFSIGKGSISGGAVLDNGAFYKRQYVLNNHARFSASIKGVPILVEHIYNKFPGYGDIRSVSNGSRWNVNFDHEAFVKQYKENLKKVVDELDEDEFLDQPVKTYKVNLENDYLNKKKELQEFISEKAAGLTQYDFLKQDSLDMDDLQLKLGSRLLRERLQVENISSDSLLKKEKIFVDSVRTLLDKAQKVRSRLEEVSNYAKAVKSKLNELIDVSDLKKDGLAGLMNASFFEKLLMGLKSFRIGNFTMPDFSGAGMGGLNGIGLGFNNGKHFGSFDMGSIRTELFSPSQAGNLSPGMNSDSVLRLDAAPKFWKASFGRGDPDKEYVRLDVSGMRPADEEAIAAYSIGLESNFILFKNIWLKAFLEKNTTVNGTEKGLIPVSDAVFRSMGDDLLRGLSHKLEFKGTHWENQLNWTAGYESMAPGLMQQFGLVSNMARNRVYFQYRFTFPGNKISSAFRWDKRTYSAAMGDYGNNSVSYLRAEIKYRFKQGRFLNFYISPSSSKYASALTDSLVQQLVKGNTIGIGGGYRKRFGGINLSSTANAELYLMRYRMNDVIHAGVLEQIPPPKSAGIQTQTDIQTQGAFSYSFSLSSVFNAAGKNTDQAGNGIPAYGNNVQGSVSSQFKVSEKFISGFGAGLYHMKGFNRSFFITPEINIVQKQHSLRAAAQINLYTAQQQNTYYGFGNRYELTYQINL